VRGDPPVLLGGVHETRDWALAFDWATTPSGADGVVAGTAALLEAEGEGPAPFVATTLKT
jgi:hypothetical protein